MTRVPQLTSRQTLANQSYMLLTQRTNGGFDIQNNIGCQPSSSEIYFFILKSSGEDNVKPANLPVGECLCVVRDGSIGCLAKCIQSDTVNGIEGCNNNHQTSTILPTQTLQHNNLHVGGKNPHLQNAFTVVFVHVYQITVYFVIECQRQ